MADTGSKLKKIKVPNGGITTAGKPVSQKMTSGGNINGAEYGSSHVIIDSGSISLDTGATADLDSGGGTDTVSLIGIAVAASGGAVAVTGDTTNGLDVDVTRLPSTTNAGATAKTSDYDTGGGTDTVTMFGIALPKSGGAAAGGTSTDPLRVDPTGTTAQPVTDNGGSLTVDGTVTIVNPAGLTFTHSNVSLGNSSTQLIASNANRKCLYIANDSDTKIYVNLAGGTATATAGIPLAAGSILALTAGSQEHTTSAITGITASGSSKSINIAEGV